MRRLRALTGLALLLGAGCQKDTLEDSLRDLTAADAAARTRAAAALAGQADPRVAPGLVRAVRDPYPEVRCAAAGALGSQPAAQAVPPLLEMLAARQASGPARSWRSSPRCAPRTTRSTPSRWRAPSSSRPARTAARRRATRCWGCTRSSTAWRNPTR
jgi:hypothetical protein